MTPCFTDAFCLETLEVSRDLSKNNPAQGRAGRTFYYALLTCKCGMLRNEPTSVPTSPALQISVGQSDRGRGCHLPDPCILPCTSSGLLASPRGRGLVTDDLRSHQGLPRAESNLSTQTVFILFCFETGAHSAALAG